MMKKQILSLIQRRSFHSINQRAFRSIGITKTTEGIIRVNCQRLFSTNNMPPSINVDSEKAAMENAKDFLKEIKDHVDEVTDYS